MPVSYDRASFGAEVQLVPEVKPFVERFKNVEEAHVSQSR